MAYRTVSHAALCMLTGTLPIYYTVELRAEKFQIKKEYLQSHNDTRSREDPVSVFYERIKIVEKRMEDKWTEWRDYRNDNWTGRLAADVCTFRRHRGYIDHFTMQSLAGYSIYNVYRRMVLKMAACR